MPITQTVAVAGGVVVVLVVVVVVVVVLVVVLLAVVVLVVDVVLLVIVVGLVGDLLVEGTVETVRDVAGAVDVAAVSGLDGGVLTVPADSSVVAGEDDGGEVDATEEDAPGEEPADEAGDDGIAVRLGEPVVVSWLVHPAVLAASSPQARTAVSTETARRTDAATAVRPPDGRLGMGSMTESAADPGRIGQIRSPASSHRDL